MDWRFNPFLLIPFMAGVFTAALIFFGWRRRPAPGAEAFSFFMLAVTIWAFGNALELGAESLPVKVLWLNFEYIGILLLPAAWLAFALQYTGRGDLLNRRTLVVLAIEPVLMLAFLWTNGSHALFFRHIGVNAADGLILQWDNVNGPFYWINITYSYYFIFLGSFLLLQFISRLRGSQWGRELVVVIGALIPWVVNVFYALYNLPIPGLDLTPFALALTGLSFAWGFFHLHIFDSKLDFVSTPENLPNWRVRALDGILRGIFLVWLFALSSGIYNVFETYRKEASFTPNALWIATGVIAVYVVVTLALYFITFFRKLPFAFRASVLLLILYALGAMGLVLSSLSGDGRVFLFAFVILTAIFFDLRYSVTAFVLSIATLVTIGLLEVQGMIVVPAERQINSVDGSAWISGTIIFLILSIATLISITYLLRVLVKSLSDSQQNLQRQKRLSRILRMVSDINQLIMREQDQEQLLKDACQFIIMGRGYAFAWIGLLQPDQVTVKMVAYAGDPVDETKFNVRLDQQDTFLTCAVHAINSRAPFRVSSTDGEDLCLGCPRLLKYPNRSAIALPLLRENRVLGVLVVDHLLVDDTFDDEEVQLLQELANDLAFALEKLETDRLLKLRMHSQSLLAEITNTALETSDMDLLLQDMSERLKEAMNADACFIVLWDETHPTPIPAAVAGASREIFLQLEGEPEEIQTAIELFRSGQTLVLDDARNDPRVSPRVADMFSIQSLLGLPLVTDRRRLGGIFLTFHETHHFTPEEVSFGEQATGQIALAVARALLLVETRANASELGVLYAAVKDMASDIMDAPTLLSKLARHMTEALNCTSGSIVAFDYSDETMSVLAEYYSDHAAALERKSDFGREYLFEAYTTITEAMSAGEPLIIHAGDKNLTEGEQKQFVDYGIQSMLFVPIMSRGRLIGDAEIWESRRKREFTQADIRLAQAMAGHAASIIENARLVDALRSSEERYRTLVEQASDGIFLADSQRRYVDVNQSGCTMLGYTREEILSMAMDDLTYIEDKSEAQRIVAELHRGGNMIIEAQLRHKNGTLLPVEISAKTLPNGYFQGIVRDITERKLAERALKESQLRLNGIITTAINGIITIDEGQKILLFNPAAETIFGYAADEVFGQSLDMLIPERFRNIHAGHVGNYSRTGVSSRQKGLLDTLLGLRKNGEEFPMEAFISQSDVDEKKFFTVILQDITERKRAEDALKASETKFRALAENIPSVVYICKNDERYSMLYLNDAVEVLTGYPKEAFLEQGLSFYDLYHPDDLPLIPSYTSLGDTTNQTSFHVTYRIRHKSGDWRWVDEWGTGVLDMDGNVQYLEGVMIDITNRKRNEEDIRRRAYELETLAAASASLRTAQNVNEMIPVLARQALRAVGGTYSSIFLLDSEAGDYVSNGWYSADDTPKYKLPNEAILRHRLGEGITGYVAASGGIYATEDIQQDSVARILDDETDRLSNVHGGVSLPIHAKEQIIGVLHVWTEERRVFNEVEIRMLTALAENAGNSIHRAMLFEQVQKQAEELSLAYDNTLAGWARALELRDELTEGHTRRVTELTVQLARALCVEDAEISHIRRGALLHDIGKMGIPDSILHKPGPLTASEFRIMRLHPQYAYDMLAPISFLRPALDIPYCHHEKWDGSGYPRGLKGDEIPLAARIFAIVDVWDALTSDRPYRRAWSIKKVREYVWSEAGKYFDPHIVKKFLEMKVGEDS